MEMEMENNKAEELEHCLNKKKMTFAQWLKYFDSVISKGNSGMDFGSDVMTLLDKYKYYFENLEEGDDCAVVYFLYRKHLQKSIQKRYNDIEFDTEDENDDDDNNNNNNNNNNSANKNDKTPKTLNPKITKQSTNPIRYYNFTPNNNKQSTNSSRYHNFPNKQ